jgi:hypothetical protein
MISANATQPFVDWRVLNALSNTIVSRVPINVAPVAYEGVHSAWFITEPSELEQHFISLQQNVTVTPGCIYRFSFAENLLTASDFTPSLTGRVFYTDGAGSQFDLISIFIEKDIKISNIDRGYTFHQKTADIPVPCDVSRVTVQFDFSVRDDGGTIWLQGYRLVFFRNGSQTVKAGSRQPLVSNIGESRLIGYPGKIEKYFLPVLKWEIGFATAHLKTPVFN